MYEYDEYDESQKSKVNKKEWTGESGVRYSGLIAILILILSVFFLYNNVEANFDADSMYEIIEGFSK